MAGKKSDRRPLELISPEGLSRQPRQVPLQIHTGDAALDQCASLSDLPGGRRSIRVQAMSKSALLPGEKKELTFILDDPSGLQVRKSLVFDADRYSTDLSRDRQRKRTGYPSGKGHNWTKHWRSRNCAPHFLFGCTGGHLVRGGKVERHPAADINRIRIARINLYYMVQLIGLA